MSGRANLERYFKLADAGDLLEAKLAYPRYHDMMQGLARKYNRPMDRITAAFCSLSPNSDYIANLRSLVSVLHAMEQGVPLERVVVATYNHCRNRAWAYLMGQVSFLEQTKGQKVLNFYHNIMTPDDPRWCTIDGHVVAAWRGRDDMTMKQAMLKPREYEPIKTDVTVLACYERILPNEYQAAVWFARKRHLRIKYSPQFDLFSDRSGITWDNVQPYAFRNTKGN